MRRGSELERQALPSSKTPPQILNSWGKKRCPFAIIWNREGLSSGTWLFSCVFLGKAACRRHIEPFTTADLESSQVPPKGPGARYVPAIYSNSERHVASFGALLPAHTAPPAHICIQNPQQNPSHPGAGIQICAGKKRRARRTDEKDELKENVTTDKAEFMRGRNACYPYQMCLKITRLYDLSPE